MSIRISEKHGVNPAIPLCFFCLMEKGEIILAGKLPNDAEAPRKSVWDRNPCQRCKSLMSHGVILISVNEKLSSDTSNPYRTGGWCCLKDEAIKRMGITPPELEADILRKRIAFIPDDAWDKLGLPRSGVPDAVIKTMPEQDVPIEFPPAADSGQSEP